MEVICLETEAFYSLVEKVVDQLRVVVVDNKLYAFGGRASSRKTGEVMSRTIQHGNIFDFETEKWLPVINQHAIPTMRVGTASLPGMAKSLLEVVKVWTRKPHMTRLRLLIANPNNG